jgi:hypothetical protein
MDLYLSGLTVLRRTSILVFGSEIKGVLLTPLMRSPSSAVSFQGFCGLQLSNLSVAGFMLSGIGGEKWRDVLWLVFACQALFRHYEEFR